MVTHVCLFWNDQPDEKAGVELLKASQDLLGKIPGPISVDCGVALASARGVVDDSFMMGLCITFPSPTVMQSFREHPLHQQYVEEYVQRLSTRRVAYDILSKAGGTDEPE